MILINRSTLQSPGNNSQTDERVLTSIINRSPQRLELLLTLMILNYLSRMVFSTSTGFLVSKKMLESDGLMILSGLSVLLHQFNPQVTADVCSLLAQAENSLTISNETTELSTVRLFRKYFIQTNNPRLDQ